MNIPKPPTIHLVLLSGPVAGGKSVVASELIANHTFKRISTGGHLVAVANERGIKVGRTELQDLGDQLDLDTDYYWPISVAISQIQSSPDINYWLLDAVRKEKQVQHFRKAFPGSLLHVHLTAPEDVIRERYAQRLADGHTYGVSTSYEQMLAHPNEISSRDLQRIADLRIDTSSSRPEAIAISISQYLRGASNAASSSR